MKFLQKEYEKGVIFEEKMNMNKLNFGEYEHVFLKLIKLFVKG